MQSASRRLFLMVRAAGSRSAPTYRRMNLDPSIREGGVINLF